jgi:hypothetical protein
VLGHRRVGSTQDVQHNLVVAAQESDQLGTRVAHIADLGLLKVLLALPHAVRIEPHQQTRPLEPAIGQIFEPDRKRNRVPPTQVHPRLFHPKPNPPDQILHV